MKYLLLSILLLSWLPSPAKPILQRIGGSFERPVWLTSPSHSSEKLFIVEQAGRVLVFDQKTQKTLPQPFLDISKDVSRKGGEEGFFSIAFAPDYQNSGRFYVNFSNHDQANEIARFTVKDPLHNFTCQPSTKEILLTYHQPYRNHNGGYLEFGPDGYLYIGTGDGGSGYDPENNSQDLSNLLGKILRIDTSPTQGYLIPSSNPFSPTQKHSEKGRPEIYAYGLRNPWRCCWDEGLFYIADVGQNKWEEVNVVTAEKLKGANFGWRLREGLVASPKKQVGGPSPEGAIDPVHVYEHGIAENQGLSINGGYVYRGSVSSLHGQYLYSDHALPHIWSFEFKDGKATKHRNLTKILARPDGKKFKHLCSFGQDSDKEVYLIEMGAGAVWKISEQDK